MSHNMKQETDQLIFYAGNYLRKNPALLWEIPLISAVINTKKALDNLSNPKSVFLHTGLAVISLISAANGIIQASKIETQKKELTSHINSDSFKDRIRQAIAKYKANENKTS
jgi:hypothetical protein